MNNRPQALKNALHPWRSALYHQNITQAQDALNQLASHATFHHCEPFGDFSNSQSFFDATFKPLMQAFPDLERRDWIVMAGDDDDGQSWVGCGGVYIGTFLQPWLNIPPTGHLSHMRFHEFYRFEGDKVVEFQAIWDIPELMVQANCWPLAPSLGKLWHVPSPAAQDGLTIEGNALQAQQSKQHVLDMLTALQRHPREPFESMEMERFWHPSFNWYGPTGIGSARGIAGFRHWHQIPFLNAMPDRGQYDHEITCHFFAEGPYVAFAGWPNMKQTLTHAGWLGLAPTGQTITLKSLDFWRLEQGKIRENWVLIDLIDIYNQLGIDPFHRMQELNKRLDFATHDYH